MANLKNTVINDTGYMQVAKGTEAQRPGSATTGMIRYNTSDDVYEAYNGTDWQQMKLSDPIVAPGQSQYTSGGSYTWTAPANVFSVQVLAIGGGGGGQNSWANPGGAGAGLGWKNNIPVVPGNGYTVVVGGGGGNGQNGGTSYFQSTSTVAGYGGGSASGQTGGPNSKVVAEAM